MRSTWCITLFGTLLSLLLYPYTDCDGSSQPSLEGSRIPEQKRLIRIRSALTINALEVAKQEGEIALSEYPNSILLKKEYLRVLCQEGSISDALLLCEELLTLQLGMREDRYLLDLLAWGTLNRGQYAPQLFVRLNALIGVSLANDARAISIICKELSSTNAILRSAAIQLSAQMGDPSLRQELLSRLSKEKVWYVRLALLEAVGRLQMREAAPFLLSLIASNRTAAEEKGLAILTLATLYPDSIDRDMEGLLISRRSGLRELACQIAVQFNRRDLVEKLYPLLSDAISDVRVAALTACTLLNSGYIAETAPLLYDAVPQVAITAAWHHLRFGQDKGRSVLLRYLQNESADIRRLAAAAVAASGTFGIEIAKESLRSTEDLFVRLNLSLGLLTLREDIPMGCKVIADALHEKRERLWMWDRGAHPLLRVLSPADTRHVDQTWNYPLMIDSMTQLELLGLLSVLEYPGALDAVKIFLKQGRTGAVGSAAGLLIQTIEEEGIEALKNLLHEDDMDVRIESALMLAIWGKDDAGLEVLIEAYPSLPRERKIQILEAMGQIGHQKAVPFLLKVLREPFHLLRIVAASALMQCIYH
jgi:HEAT repeat protein